MRIIENAKAYMGNRAIGAYLHDAKRELRSCNIYKAETIGILFNATHEVSFEIVKEMVKKLSSKENDIEVLGYVDSKQMIDHYLYRKGFEFFTRNQLNWYYKPMAEIVEKFIKKPFDLLIDLSLDNPFPIRYIVSCSAAKFKAGRYLHSEDYLDFMIDIEKEKKTMSDIRHELEKDLVKNTANNKEVEKIVNKKIQTEIQLNFLINQLLHYLSTIKN
jgi:hypothetical protein